MSSVNVPDPNVNPDPNAGAPGPDPTTASAPGPDPQVGNPDPGNANPGTSNDAAQQAAARRSRLAAVRNLVDIPENPRVAWARGMILGVVLLALMVWGLPWISKNLPESVIRFLGTLAPPPVVAAVVVFVLWLCKNAIRWVRDHSDALHDPFIGFCFSVCLIALLLWLRWLPTSWPVQTQQTAETAQSGTKAPAKASEKPTKAEPKLRPDDPATAAACFAEPSKACFAAWLMWFAKENTDASMEANKVQWVAEQAKKPPVADAAAVDATRLELLKLGHLKLDDKKEVISDGTPRGDENLQLVNRLYGG